jgi:hypothetical protein
MANPETEEERRKTGRQDVPQPVARCERASEQEERDRARALQERMPIQRRVRGRKTAATSNYSIACGEAEDRWT